jgi:hypothetical protein
MMADDLMLQEATRRTSDTVFQAGGMCAYAKSICLFHLVLVLVLV